MDFEAVIALLKIGDMVATAVVNYGVDLTKYHQMVAAARSENRSLTQAELLELANDTQAAIDAIGTTPTP